MKSFVTSLSTTLIVRITLLLFGSTSIVSTQFQDNWHHAYVGIILLLLFKLFRFKYSNYLTWIGIGLIIDEACLIYPLFGVTEFSYWSVTSIGTASLIYFIWFLMLKRKDTNV